MGVSGQRQAPAALPPGKTRYPLYRRVGPDGCGKSRPHRDSVPRQSSPKTSSYTDRRMIHVKTVHLVAGSLVVCTELAKKLSAREWVGGFYPLNYSRILRLPHYLINDIRHKTCVLIYSTTFVWNISHSKKKRARDVQNCVLVFMYSTGYSCQTLMKPEFLGKFLKNTQIQICVLITNYLHFFTMFLSF